MIDIQANHIVSINNTGGRQILTQAGIDVNPAANGVFLPTQEGDDAGNATVHYGSHVANYNKCVNDALKNAKKYSQTNETLQENILIILDTIRNILLTQHIPINSMSDSDYNPDGLLTIKDYFQEKKL